MFKYYNPHPKGLTVNDCVIRALSTVTGMNYATVLRKLKAFRQVTGARCFYSDNNPHHFVEDVLEGKKLTFADSIFADDFCKMHHNGRYILDMDGHWSCCVNGIIYDTWDCSQETVNFAYEVTSEGFIPPNLNNQVFKYCCTSERISDADTLIRIFDGNGISVERQIPTKLTEGYVRCLQDSKYNYIEL